MKSKREKKDLGCMDHGGKKKDTRVLFAVFQDEETSGGSFRGSLNIKSTVASFSVKTL